MTDPADEALDRIRRIETKVTKIGELQGIDMGGRRPIYQDNAVHAPSPLVSLAHCLDVVPKSNVRVVPVKVRGTTVAWISHP